MNFLPYARLLRLPNVFTAFGDILLGLCVALHFNGGSFDNDFAGRLALLLLASGSLYLAGMVWNDYFDLEEDRRDRPFRPLPSGKIPLRTAAIIGLLLVLLGGISAFLSGWLAEENPTPGILGGLLIVAIIGYNRVLKRTPLGPVSMGLCRFLNVLLGLTLIGDALPTVLRYHLAAAVGVYIIGVTWFAKNEAGRSSPKALKGAVIVILAGILLALAVPGRLPTGTAFIGFPYLLAGFALLISGPLRTAVENPSPTNVQAAIKRCVLGLVVFDAIIGTIFVGLPGLLIVLLLPPALWIGKRVYST